MNLLSMVLGKKNRRGGDVSPPPAREFFYLSEGIGLTRLRSGHFIYVDPLEESVCAHLIAHGQWEPWARDVVLGLIEPGDHVLEIGGHVGYYTLGMAHKVGPQGSVTTFEANPRLAALARRSVRFNGYSGWVDVRQQAVSNEAGRLRFTVSRQFGGGGHIYVRDGALGADSDVIEVDAVRIDELKLPEIKLVRIDAEGSEPLILRGAEKLLQKPDIVLCIEWDIVQMRSRTPPAEFAAWLAGMGFRFWMITTCGKLEPVAVADLLKLAPCDLVVSRHRPRAAGADV
ncbi:Protein-L-isoaspartate O-methyltransferase [compost metagenome]